MAALSLWNPEGPWEAQKSRAGLPWTQGHLGCRTLLPALPKSVLSPTDSDPGEMPPVRILHIWPHSAFVPLTSAFLTSAFPLHCPHTLFSSVTLRPSCPPTCGLSSSKLKFLEAKGRAVSFNYYSLRPCVLQLAPV